MPLVIFQVAAATAALFPAVHSVSSMAMAREQALRVAAEAKARSEIGVLERVALQGLDQQLRICNAYARDVGLEVGLARTGQTIGSLHYKECHDYNLALKANDRFTFTASDLQAPGMQVGSFGMSELSDSTTMLLLVVQRRSSSSLDAAFQSHIFTEGRTSLAQVAVLDAYKGADHAQPSLRLSKVVPRRPHGGNAGDEEAAFSAMQQPPQDLLLGGVAEIGPGSYQVSLEGAGQVQLGTQPGTCYVVLRVGDSDATDSSAAAFPEELVVFPPPSTNKVVPQSFLEKVQTALHSAAHWVWN